MSVLACMRVCLRGCEYVTQKRERERESEAYIGDVLFVTEVKEGTLAM